MGNIFTRDILDDYIKCPHFLGLSMISTSKKRKLNIDMSNPLKKFLLDISHNELTNGEKEGIASMRVAFTNSFSKILIKNFNFIKPQTDMQFLNKVFKIFANSKVCAYNIPIDINVPKTQYKFRSYIDFMLMSAKEEIIIVDFEDYENKEDFDRKILSWPQYTAQYFKLSKTLEKNIKVYLVNIKRKEILELSIVYNEKIVDMKLKDLYGLISTINFDFLIKRFSDGCSKCDFFVNCVRDNYGDI